MVSTYLGFSVLKELYNIMQKSCHARLGPTHHEQSGIHFDTITVEWGPPCNGTTLVIFKYLLHWTKENYKNAVIQLDMFAADTDYQDERMR